MVFCMVTIVLLSVANVFSRVWTVCFKGAGRVVIDMVFCTVAYMALAVARLFQAVDRTSLGGCYGV